MKIFQEVAEQNMSGFTFTHNGDSIHFSLLEKVGASSHTFQILINKYFVGNLKCDGLEWRFEGGVNHGIEAELANLIGEYVIAWYEGAD